MSDIFELQSIRAQIEALDIGDTYARAQRFDGDATRKEVPPDALRGMRLNMQSTVHRIEVRTGNKYTIEVGEFRTYSRDIMVCVCVTRTD